MSYSEFLESKQRRTASTGIDIDPSEINPILFPFQRDVLRWALKKGNAAVFADTGLGKTFIQLEWARLLGGTSLIFAPLSVARQTVREAVKIGLTVKYVRHEEEIEPGINITNYDNIDNFPNGANWIDAVILDESSILKAIDGKTKQRLTTIFSKTQYKLCCTATPSPNDYIELGNHAEFLNVCTMPEMLATYFINANKVSETVTDSGIVLTKKHGNQHGTEWRLKHHAHDAFFRWLSSWAMALRRPSNLGYEDAGFALPSLNTFEHLTHIDYQPEDELFFTGLHGLKERANVRRQSAESKLSKAVKLTNNSEQWIVWCGLDRESELLANAIPDSVEVKGSDTPEYKAECFEKFQDGAIRVLVTKPKIGGFGMNFQNCHNMIFFGMNDSWESYYQSVRRCYRFGQKEPVNVHILISDIELEILQNVKRKGEMAEHMMNELINDARIFETEELGKEHETMNGGYRVKTIESEMFRAMLGDSCERLKELEGESIDLSVYSPPFADLYTYSASERDLGNSRNWDEFFDHYKYVIEQVFRVTKKGRLSCVHTSDIPAMQMKDGYIGIRDFPGAVVKAHEAAGWIFHGRAIVTKNPQAQAIRTKSKALLFVQLRKDSSDSRPALLDHILIFKKPGEAEATVNPVQNGEIDNEKWIDWAGGIWTGINEFDTLQYTTARDKDDEKHICPLQLGTIERCIKLYSNPGERVLTPFGGIGSEGYEAIKYHRKAVLVELKESYFNILVKNMKEIESKIAEPELFAKETEEMQ